MDQSPLLRPGAAPLRLEDEFDQACVIAVHADPELLPLKEELLRLARDHERRPEVIRNLRKQLRMVQQHLGKGDLLRNQKRRAATIETVGALFMRAIKVHRDQQNWSLARRLQEASKNSLKEAVSSLIREVPRDAGRTTTEKT